MTAELGKPNTPIAIASFLNYWLLGSWFLSLVSPCQDGCSLVGDRSTVKVSKKDSWENQLFKAMNPVQGLGLDSHRCSGKEHHVSFFPKMFLLP